jgi:hypothetical protein
MTMPRAVLLPQCMYMFCILVDWYSHGDVHHNVLQQADGILVLLDVSTNWQSSSSKQDDISSSKQDDIHAV